MHDTSSTGKPITTETGRNLDSKFPGWREQFTARHSKSAPTPSSGRRFKDQSDRERRAVAYLAKMPGATAGQGGHRALMAAARAMCWGFDLGEEAGYRILADHFNPRCAPPWSEAELRHKCRDAMKADGSRAERGHLLDKDRDDYRPGSRPSSSSPSSSGRSNPGHFSGPRERSAIGDGGEPLNTSSNQQPRGPIPKVQNRTTPLPPLMEGFDAETGILTHLPTDADTTPDGARPNTCVGGQKFLNTSFRTCFPQAAAIIGPQPCFRPCRYPRFKHQEGCSAVTDGGRAIRKVCCRKCHPCQVRRKWEEKTLHVPVALASATHTVRCDDGRFDAIRKKIERNRKKSGNPSPLRYCRVENFTVLSLPDAESLDLPADVIPTASQTAAEELCGAIEGIMEFGRMKGQWRIKKSRNWLPKADTEEPKETHWRNVEGHIRCFDFDWVEDVIREAAQEQQQHIRIVREAGKGDRVEESIIWYPSADTDSLIMRRLAGDEETTVAMPNDREYRESEPENAIPW